MKTTGEMIACADVLLICFFFTSVHTYAMERYVLSTSNTNPAHSNVTATSNCTQDTPTEYSGWIQMFPKHKEYAINKPPTRFDLLFLLANY